MAQLGLYYFNPTLSFPGVVVKSLENGKVLVKVLTDYGDELLQASIVTSPSTGGFVVNT